MLPAGLVRLLDVSLFSLLTVKYALAEMEAGLGDTWAQAHQINNEYTWDSEHIGFDTA